MDMDLDTAMTIIARSAGDDLCAFVGEPRPGVSDEAQQEAGRWLMAEYLGDSGVPSDMVGLSDDERVAYVIHEVKAQAFEDVWHAQVNRWLKRSSKRGEVLAFLEERMGRPLPRRAALP